MYFDMRFLESWKVGFPCGLCGLFLCPLLFVPTGCFFSFSYSFVRVSHFWFLKRFLWVFDLREFLSVTILVRS